MSFSTDKRFVARFLLPLGLVFLFLLNACKRDPNPDSPVGQSINTPLENDPNRAYQILSVTFTGIPYENVKIDQRTRVITVNLPAGFVSDDLKPVTTLTQNTTLAAGLGSDRPFRLESFCYCNTTATALIKPTGATPSQTGVQYTIVAKPAAPLALKPIPAPLEIPLSEYTTISLPVDNPYGNPPVGRAYVQKTDGGTSILLQGSETNANGCVWFTCDPKQPGTLTFTFSPANIPDLTPGTYTLFLEQAGNRLTLSQPVRFVRGEVRLDVNRFFGYSIDQTENSFTIRGNNLFADEITGNITNQNGEVRVIKPVTSVPNGTSMLLGLTTAAELAPGYYALQLQRNGVDLGSCLRLSVRQSPRHPVIHNMNANMNCLAKEPVVLRRSVRQSFVITYSSKPTLKLTSATDPGRSYLIDVVIPIEAFPQFTIPETVPPGSYRATVQTPVNGQTVESEPFEQPVEVQ